MKILITGASGFIGKNLIAALTAKGYTELYKCDIQTTIEKLEYYTAECDFVYHLAAIHRPVNDEEYDQVNRGLTEKLTQLLKEHKNHCPVLVTSTIQAIQDTAYGRSKQAAEKLVFDYGRETGARPIVYRLTNLFGKWGTPNHHSVVATFCYNIARDLPIRVDNPSVIMNLCHIDHVIDCFIRQLTNEEEMGEDGYYHLDPKRIHAVSLEKIAERLYTFKKNLGSNDPRRFEDEFVRELFATYLAYLPEAAW